MACLAAQRLRPSGLDPVPFRNSSLLLEVGLARRDGLLAPWPDVRLTGVRGGPEADVGTGGASLDLS